MRFGLLVRDSKINVVRGFVDGNPQRNLAVLTIADKTFVVLREEFESLNTPGAIESVRKMISALWHINDVSESVSVINTMTGTVEDYLEHIQRMHRERDVPGGFSLRSLRSQGGFDQESDQPIDH